MKTIKTIVLSALIFLLCSSFNERVIAKKIQTKETLLVLQNPMNKESFSKFIVLEEEGILIGYNTESEDYPVKDGIYRIEGTSNDKFYHKRIIIAGN
jgi:hypothetical protein